MSIDKCNLPFGTKLRDRITKPLLLTTQNCVFLWEFVGLNLVHPKYSYYIIYWFIITSWFVKFVKKKGVHVVINK